MKGKKCFGLLSLLFIIFGLSLSVFSDTNALKYSIETIPLAPQTLEFRKVQDYQTGDYFYISFSKNNSPGISSVRDSGDFDSGFQYPRTWRFTGDYDSVTNTCSLPQNDDSYYTDGVLRAYGGGSNTYSYRLKAAKGITLSFDYYNLLSPDSPFDFSRSISSQWSDFSNNIDYQYALCSLWHYSYNGDAPIDSNFPTWNWSSLINIPLVNNRLIYEASKPFTYQFDTLNIVGYQRNDDGFIYVRDGVKASELFGIAPSTFSHLGFPLNDFTEADSWLSPDDTDDETAEEVYSFDVLGSIIFDEDYTLGSNADVFLGVYNFYNPYLLESDFSSYWTTINNHHIYDYSYDFSYDDSVCSVIEKHVSSGDSENRLDFSCHYDPISANAYFEKINFRYLDISLNFSGDSNGFWNYDSFLTTTGDYTFKDFYIVTNNNYTDSGWSGSSAPSGGATENTPGSIVGGDVGDVDWFSSLTNMFNFNIINPFSPIFNLFVTPDNNACTHIPIIAGMLHAEDDTYCPWFSQSTRNILTPVLGLASVMLVFGFLVRWLGSSSGNMFTDSANEEVSNQGGRWGHFKRGG